MVAKCPALNTSVVDQEAFWDGNWTPHKIGWLIAGCAAALTTCISLFTISGHLLHYNKPLEQRQVIRVLLFPVVYAIISFFSYRFFRAYTYYELIEAGYESFAIAAFLMLMLQFIGKSVQDQVSVFARKDKKPLPIPFCCWRYRPSKAYFLVLLKWSVVQYCFIRPALSIAGIVTEAYGVYCSSRLSYKYAYVYLTSIDFVSISIALYGLIVLYTLVKEDLKGRRPLAKFATIKLGIFLIFYQGFIFSMLANHGVLHATTYWTTENISDGLNALCTTCEMVLIAALQLWAFNWKEYRIDRLSQPDGKANAKGRTNPFTSLLHALNFFDIFVEFWYELVFLFDRIRGKPYTRRDARLDFVQAFGAEHDDDDDSQTEKRHQEALRRMESSSHDRRTPEMSGEGHMVYMDGGWNNSRHNTSVPGSAREAGDSTRSTQPLLRPPIASPPLPTHLQDGTQISQQQRPRSWEPQAL
jgi:hypothetical protein